LSKKSSNSLIVKLKVSVALAASLIFLHVGAGVLLALITIPVAMKIVLALALAASLYRSLRRHGLRRGTAAVHSLKLSPDGVWSVRHIENEEWLNVNITSRFVHRWIVLLSVRIAGQRLATTLAIAADAIEAETFRRLRAALLAPPRNPAV